MNKPKHLNKVWPTRVKDVLSSHHLADLKKSGLSNKTILAARIYSLSSKEATAPLKRKKEIGGGYVIPYIGKDGFLESDLNFKLDTPLLSEEGKKPRKYIRPFGAKAHLYIPPKVWPIIGNVKVPIFLTEGEKKALKATECGFYTVAVSGVWNWSSDHEPIKDLDLFEWRERVVYIVFDSDKHENKSVLLAEKRLAEALTAKGAKIKIIDLPEEDEHETR
ncbi:MAG: DUF3854 domain-containing protein [Candidatus Omnitrophota bacterium]